VPPYHDKTHNGYLTAAVAARDRVLVNPTGLPENATMSGHLARATH